MRTPPTIAMNLKNNQKKMSKNQTAKKLHKQPKNWSQCRKNKKGVISLERGLGKLMGKRRVRSRKVMLRKELGGERRKSRIDRVMLRI
jgi:hypothetical protein